MQENSAVEHVHGSDGHVHLPDLGFRAGPVAWCKRCSREHPRRACDLKVLRPVDGPSLRHARPRPVSGRVELRHYIQRHKGIA